jgi:hypothetical protein
LACSSSAAARAGNFSDSSFNSAQFFSVALTLSFLDNYESGEEVLQPEEIQQRFKIVFGRDMDRTERDVFFLPVEPSPEQEDED